MQEEDFASVRIPSSDASMKIFPRWDICIPRWFPMSQRITSGKESDTAGHKEQIRSYEPSDANGVMQDVSSEGGITAGNLLRPTRPLTEVYESRTFQTSTPSSGSQQHCIVMCTQLYEPGTGVTL